MEPPPPSPRFFGFPLALSVFFGYYVWDNFLTAVHI
jgi:hypothetical protein